MNTQHHNITFTSETENNNSIPFLDTCIHKMQDGTLTTSVYRKPTHTGLGLNFFSFTSRTFKLNSIKTLLQRAYSISSNYSSLHTEFEFLKRYFINNKYPLHLIDNSISSFLNKKFMHNNKIVTVPKLKQYVKLPFYGDASFTMRNKIRQILSSSFNHVDFQFVFTNPYNISTFFPFKDRVPLDVQSSVVYEFTCSSCNAGYIGSTTRSFKTRRLEHQGRSIHTGRPLASPTFSNIRNHSEQHDHPIHSTDFKILKSLPDRLSLLVAESMFIRDNKPSLNNSLTAYPLNF